MIRRTIEAPSILRKAVNSIPAVRIRNFNEHYGNFPITNFGSFGVETGVPVIASPAIAVLCVGAVKNGTAVLPLTLVFDHRCLDGAMGGAFLSALKNTIENESAAVFDLPAAGEERLIGYEFYGTVRHFSKGSCLFHFRLLEARAARGLPVRARRYGLRCVLPAPVPHTHEPPR